MKVYNTMSRTKEEFRPIRSECVTIDHADGYAFFLKRIDITEFVLGQAVRMYFLNLKLF